MPVISIVLVSGFRTLIDVTCRVTKLYLLTSATTKPSIDELNNSLTSVLVAAAIC